MLNYNITTIEDLVKENEQLKVARQKVEDKKNEANSKLQTKISAYETKIKALNDKAFRNDYKAKNKFAQIDRMIEENEGQIKVKAKLGSKVANETTRKVVKTTKVCKNVK